MRSQCIPTFGSHKLSRRASPHTMVQSFEDDSGISWQQCLLLGTVVLWADHWPDLCPRDLEKREKEAKEREKEERRRKERLNRDAFKELLQRHLAEGVLVARMRWKVRALPCSAARVLTRPPLCMHVQTGACHACMHLLRGGLKRDACQGLQAVGHLRCCWTYCEQAACMLDSGTAASRRPGFAGVGIHRSCSPATCVSYYRMCLIVLGVRRCSAS